MGFFNDVWKGITGQTAADKAHQAQKEATAAASATTEATLKQQMEMFRENQEMLAPFVGMSKDAMGQMSALTGGQGMGAQQSAISAIENSPMFQSQVQQGENALLQNASATGGLRGGNMQASLSQFRPGMLQNQIQQQYANLGGVANLGMSPLSQASAGFGQMAGAQGQAGANMSNLLMQAGDNQAANHLAGYQLQRNFVGDLFGAGMKVANLGVDAEWF